MNLRKATSLLILGSIYIILHKAIFAVFPSAGRSEAVVAVTSVLWLAAVFALILFAYEFLVEVAPRDRWMRGSLIAMIVFVGVIIFTKLPLGLVAEGGAVHHLLFGAAGLCNGLAVLVFLFSLRRCLSRESTLWKPTMALIGACVLTCVLGLVALAYLLVFLLTAREMEPLAFLPPLSVFSFVLTQAAVLWFLVRFRPFPVYRDLARDVRGCPAPEGG